MKGFIFAAGLLLGAACTTSVLHQSTRRADAPPLTVEASPERTARLIAAFDEIQAILEDPTFAEAIKAFDHQPLATSADESCRTTKASDVLAAMKTRLPSHVLGSRCSLLHPLSTAATTACVGSWINTRRIDRWEDATKEQRGTLINTLAHEMTHVLPEEGAVCSSSSDGAYTDEGHIECKGDQPQCNDAFLVSYVWGDLVECAYRVKHEGIPKAAFRECVMGLVNSGQVTRATLVPQFKNTSSECQSITPWKAVE
ncbi:hypothetical protein [Hyalangium versicolor]|uniref:hypothetical protein n=1 Tax=Hyalangium versicolor TaxID=2861190 RepID=UPI001CCD32CA|nr:hypothetical protein [Hyalangium versicolor]